MNRIIGLAILVLTLAGCSIEDKEKEKTTSHRTPAIQFETTPEGLQYGFTKAQPGFYKIYFRFPSHIPNISVYLENGQQYAANPNMNHGILIPQGMTFKIIYPHSNTEYGEQLYSTLKSPKDLIVDREIKLQESTTFEVGRVYFTPEGQIITMGHDLKILADEIYSDQQVVSALIKNKKDRIHLRLAPENFKHDHENFELIHGGNIEIYAKSAVGQFSFNISGSDGANGAAGINGQRDSKLDGTPGIPGMAMGALGDHHCTPGKSGTSGTKGHNGTDGGDGAPGGDSASFTLQILTPNESYFFIHRKAGMGGKKGLKGIGGPGGYAGKASQSMRCGGAAGGQRNGDPGDDGKDGNDGKNGQLNDLNIGLKQRYFSVLAN